MSTNIDIDEIRGRYDLRDFVAAAIGQPVRRSREYHTFTCPWHGGASLQVWHDHYKCFGSCGKYGDIFQFVQDHENKTFAEALHQLANMELPVYKPAVHKPAPYKAPVNYKADALKAADNFAVALPYLQQRKVQPTVAIDHLAGAVIEYPHGYQKLDGSWLNFKCLRYSFPNTLGDTVRGINHRLDEDSAYLAISRYQDQIAELREDYNERLKADGKPSIVLSAAKVVELAFGDKYLRKGPMLAYNADLLVRMLPDGRREMRSWSAMLINEGKEIDVLSVLSAGYPIVGIPQKNSLDFVPAFARVSHKIIVADNDGGKGMEKALWIKSRLGEGMIISPPNPFKDLNDMLLAGELDRWLGNYIEPILLTEPVLVKKS